MARPRVLVTGFGPFPGIADNSSAWLAEMLAKRSRTPRLECTLHSDVLPTEWAEVGRLGPGLLARHRPRLVLHFGLSKRAKGFRIERFAYNSIDARMDARGRVPTVTRILPRGAPWLATQVPATRLAKHLRARALPAAASRSAGTYLCNYLYYVSLDWACRQKGPCDVCFVHIPPHPSDGGPLSEAELVRGAELILHYLLAFTGELDRGAAVEKPEGRPLPVRPMWR